MIETIRHRLPHGIELSCRVSGTPGQPVLLFLHGFPEAAFAWDELLAHFAQTEHGGYRCVAPNLRGFADSSSPADVAAYRAKHLVQDVLSLIDAESSSAPLAALVAHDWGGAVAWNFAATRPERISHLILVDSSGFGGGGPQPLIARLTRLPVVGDLGIWFKPELLVRDSLLDAYGDPAMVTPERVRRFAELQRFPGNRHATLLRARTQEPLDTSVLKRLDVPTLILWGARDRWTPPANAFRFQQTIRASRVAIFEKLGHNPMEEDSKATAAAVDAFLPDRKSTRLNSSHT